MARDLALAGVTIISGLARGIDGAAHRGALEAGGRTIAVFATGLANIYPPEHGELACEIRASGALLTEAVLHQLPKPGLFPQRNRIISGLSRGVVVVEASRRSGALHTSKHALEQGRDVFAVPGRISDPASLGCHDLIRDGAVLVRGAEDILEGIQWRFPSDGSPGETTPASDLATERKSKAAPISPPPAPRPVANLSPEEQRLVESLGDETVPIDRLLVESSQPADEILPMLTILEMKRVIRRLPGGYIERAQP